MKISTALTLALGIIGAIAIADFGNAAYHAARNYQTVQKLRALVNARGVWFQALISLSSERSLTQVILNSPTTGLDDIKALLKSTRVNTDELLKSAQTQLADVDEFATQVELLGDIEAALAAIIRLRGEADAMMQTPFDQRDMSKADALVSDIKSLITDMEGMAVHMITMNELTPTDTVLLSRLQEDAFEVREYGGRARSIYAIATLNNTIPSPADRVYAHSMLQRSIEAWEQIIHISETVPIPEDVRAQLDQMEKGITKDFASLLDNLRVKADADDALRATATETAGSKPALDETAGFDYGMTFAEYFASSSAALGTASELAKITGQALDETWLVQAGVQRRDLIIDVLAVLALASLLGATMLVISRKITRRLEGGLADLAALTAGDLAREISHKKGDLQEIENLTAALADLQTQLRRADAAQSALATSESAQQNVVARLTEGLNSLAAGDLSQRITDQFDPKYQGLADNFNAATAALGDLVARVIDTANSILSGARGISEATTELSQRTETQGATLQNAAAALEQLTRNIVDSQADATELDALAGLALDKGNGMGATMSHTVAAMEAIKTSSQQIEQIVGVIEDIAFQTNLLALNAGVEATRAGAEGSGFAVIASEVRGLAERSAQSAQDIKALIAASGGEVAKGVEFVAEAEASTGDIGEHIQKISGLISRIAIAATQQSQGLIKVNDGVSQLDLVTQNNVAMVEETTAECASLTNVAQDLSQLVRRFQITQASPLDFEAAARAA